MDDVQAIFSLSCVRRYTSSDSRGEQIWHEDIFWQDRASFEPDELGRDIRIDFLFKTLIGLPATEEESDNYHFWQLHVHLPMHGVDYNRVFNVPMEGASEQKLASTERYTAKESQRIAHEKTGISDEPKIKDTAAGLQLYYGHGRSKGMAIGIFLFGSFFAVFGYYFFDGFVGFLPVTTGLMAGFVGLTAFTFCLLGLLMMANSLTVEVSLMGIRKKQRIFWFSLNEFTDANDIIDIKVEQNSSSGGGKSKRVWYCLKLMTADGLEMEVGDSLEGQSYANRIRQKMIDALGITWQAATLTPQQDKVKKTATLVVKNDR